jgi:hypothetical protein
MQTEQQKAVANRNHAIAGRNRNLEQIWRMLGCPDRYRELPFEPYPESPQPRAKDDGRGF